MSLYDTAYMLFETVNNLMITCLSDENFDRMTLQIACLLCMFT